jgi:hypothetical protein
MLAAAGGPWYGEARCCAVVALSSHASICGDVFTSWGTRFSPYGDTVNLSRCFYCPAILTLCVNPQQRRKKKMKERMKKEEEKRRRREKISTFSATFISAATDVCRSTPRPSCTTGSIIIRPNIAVILSGQSAQFELCSEPRWDRWRASVMWQKAPGQLSGLFC